MWRRSLIGWTIVPEIVARAAILTPAKDVTFKRMKAFQNIPRRNATTLEKPFT